MANGQKPMAISIGKNTEFMGGYPTKSDNCPYFSYICPANKLE